MSTDVHRPRLVLIPWPLIACLAIILLCGISSVLVALANLPPGVHSHSPIQVLGGAFFPGLTRNYDLLCYVDRFKAWGTPEFFQDRTGQMFNYAAPAAIALKLLYSVPLRPTRTFSLLLLSWLLLAGTLTIRSFMRTGLSAWRAILVVAVMLVASFPLFLLKYLANFELVVWIVLSVGLWAFVTGRLWLAAFCFSLAGSFKYFPLIFLGLFADRRHWQKILFGIASFAMLMGASLRVMGPNIRSTSAGLQAQMKAFTAVYLYQWHADSSPIDHSVVGAVKVPLHFAGHIAWMPTLSGSTSSLPRLQCCCSSSL